MGALWLEKVEDSGFYGCFCHEQTGEHLKNMNINQGSFRWVGGGLKLAVEVPLLGQSCAPARFSLSAADGPVGMAPPSPFPSLACGAGCEDSEVAEEQEGGPVLGSSHLLPYL